MMATPRAKSQVDHLPTETRRTVSTGLGSQSYNNLLNLQACPFSGVRRLCRLAPGSGGPPAASVRQLRRCLLSQPARCLRLKMAETQCLAVQGLFLIYYTSGSVIMS